VSLSSPKRSIASFAPNLIYFNEVDKGGDFAACEEPELFSSELRAAFRSMRQEEGSLS
jgi:hypothetical protein